MIQKKGEWATAGDENEVLGQGSPMKLVIAHGNVELVKGMRKPKGSKRAKDAQEKKQNGHRSPQVERPMAMIRPQEKE